MKYTLTEEKPCKRVFKVELDGPEYQRARAHAYAEVGGKINMPGFRKGKVSPQVLEQRFGKELQEETIQHAIGHSARTILADTKLSPVTNPAVSSIHTSGEGMAFLLTIELAPEVVLEEYRGLSLTREAVMVRPEDADSVVEGLRRRMATYTSVDRPARWGDLAVIDYDGTVDGSPFEGSTGRDVLVFIGSRETMREIEESLVGRRVGETMSLTVAYPANHTNQALAGKTAVLSVNLKELKTAKLPELDDEFARASGDYKTMEDMRRTVAERLRSEREREVRERLRAVVVDRLLRFVPTEVAPTLVEEEMQYMAVRGAEELARQGLKGIQQLRLDAKQFKEMFRPSAGRAVREAFVLEAISRKEGIAVTDADLEREIRENHPNEKGVPDKLFVELKANGRWERLRHRLRQDRTLDWVISQGHVTERALCL